MNRNMLMIAFLILVGSMRAACGQSAADSANDSATPEYKAMARPDIEALGGRHERHPLHDNEALTRGLNRLAADKWILTAIEPASTGPIGGPSGASAATPATYVFARRRTTRNAIERIEATGAYLVIFPRGATRPAKFVHHGQDQYRLEGAGVLDGVYRREGNKMIVTDPNDERMTGLIWTRTEYGWRLTSETPGTPTGSSYVGTKLSVN